ncbi:ATP-dependent DNA helicase [Trichonephila clavipes]|nr:ATP-dependent DNA helicase [Trichonephila clavipes]
MGYINILKENLKQSAQDLNLGDDFWFQQDNDPKHTTHNVKLWLLYNIKKNQLRSPPQSSDLNPIEHYGTYWERKIRQHHITAKEMLKREIVTEWNTISSEETSKLVQSMPTRLTQALRPKKVARFNETFPQAELRRLEQVEREVAHRAAETPEQSQAWHRRHAEYLATQRAAKTPEHFQARRLQQATYMASQRDTETIEAAESRKCAVTERAQRRHLIFSNTWEGEFNKAAFEYDETLDYESHRLIKIEAMNKECRFAVLLNGKRNLQDRLISNNNKVGIHPDRVPRGEYERQFNAPTTNEITAVVVSSERTTSRDIVIQAHDDRLTRVPYTHGLYDALEYPIIFWKWQEGYNFDIPQINPFTKQPIPNKIFSYKYIYAYHMMDAFTYMHNYGRYDLFITMTCNPDLPEITGELIPAQNSTDRHELTARVFKLMEKLRSNQIDELISEEIPNPETDRKLYDTVTKNMIHGPCGALNPSSPCMKEKKMYQKVSKGAFKRY